MGKFLIWFVIILAGLTVSRLFNARLARRGQAMPQGPRGPEMARTGGGAEPMVRCAHCGIYLPRSEAVFANKLAWCSHEHARLGPAQDQG